MFYIALKMLMGDRAKYAGLIIGIAFTAFLVTFALSCFAGFMTRGFALITENSTAGVRVMDPAVESPELTINIPTPPWKECRALMACAMRCRSRSAMRMRGFPTGVFSRSR